MINSYACKACNIAVNGCLSLDPEAQDKVAALDGKVITVKFLPWEEAWQITFENKQVNFLSGEHGPADLTITGTPLGLLGGMLAWHNSTEQGLWLLSDLSIAGDINLGRQFMELFSSLEVDWEEYIAQIFGDTIARQLSNLAHKFRKWSSVTKERLLQNISEYLQEESALLAPPCGIRDFLHEVDELRLRVDRLAARIKDIK